MEPLPKKNIFLRPKEKMKILNMKNITHCLKVALVTAVLLIPVKEGMAQEESIRSGSAGASELLINPWARSSGWGASNVAGVAGLEGQYVNIAGLASTEKTELIFAQTCSDRGDKLCINWDSPYNLPATINFLKIY